MKFLAFRVIFLLAVLRTFSCEQQVQEIASNESENKDVENESNNVPSVKNKRGIIGYPLSYSVPSPYAHSHAHAYHRNLLIPPLHRIPAGYALTPGGATVHSFNVNYPRYNFIQPKPVVPIARPVLVPSVGLPPVVFPTKQLPLPIIPHLHRFPAIVPRPFAFHKSVVPFFPAPVTPHITPIAPVPPVTPVVHSVPTTHFNPVHFASLPIPHLHPVIAPASVSPHGVIPHHGAGTTFTSSGWNPLIFNQPEPVLPTSTDSINRPSISLLPPYPPPASSSVGTEVVKPVYETPNKPNNAYLTPIETHQQNQQEQLEQYLGNFPHF